MPKHSFVKGTLPKSTQIAKHPNWTILPQAPIFRIEADTTVECDIDPNGVGRVRMLPGYPAITLDEIRYFY